MVESTRFGGDLKEATRAAVHRLGFEWFRWVVSYRDGAGLGADRDLLNGSPDGWSELYKTRNYRAFDPLFREAAERCLPRFWDQTTFRDNPLGHEIYEAAALYGMGHGIHMLVHAPQSNPLNFFIVAAPERRIDATRRRAIARSFPELWAIGTYGRKLLPMVPRPGTVAAYRFSARELECLKCVAQGMTSRDIGDALGISDRTVDAHIAHAISKTGARNRREALARAIGNGQLIV